MEPSNRGYAVIISAVIAAVMGWIAVVKFTLDPVEMRINTARENFIRAIAERDARLEYIQRRLDELERACRQQQAKGGK